MKMKTWFGAILVGALVTSVVIAFADTKPQTVQRATMPGISCSAVMTDGIYSFRVVAWKTESFKHETIKECLGRAVNSTPGPNDQTEIWAPVSASFEGIQCLKTSNLFVLEFRDPRLNDEGKIRACFREAEEEKRQKEERERQEEKESLPSA